MRILSLVIVAIALATASTASTATAAAPPLRSLVLKPGELPGWVAPAKVAVQGPAAFAKEHNKTTKAILATGFVSGVTVFLKGPGNALSIAVRHHTPEQARREALRLYRSNLKTDPGITATPFTIQRDVGSPCVPDGRERGRQAGRRLRDRLRARN